MPVALPMIVAVDERQPTTGLSLEERDSGIAHIEYRAPHDRVGAHRFHSRCILLLEHLGHAHRGTAGHPDDVGVGGNPCQQFAGGRIPKASDKSVDVREEFRHPSCHGNASARCNVSHASVRDDLAPIERWPVEQVAPIAGETLLSRFNPGTVRYPVTHVGILLGIAAFHYSDDAAESVFAKIGGRTHRAGLARFQATCAGFDFPLRSGIIDYRDRRRPGGLSIACKLLTAAAWVRKRLDPASKRPCRTAATNRARSVLFLPPKADPPRRGFLELQFDGQLAQQLVGGGNFAQRFQAAGDGSEVTWGQVGDSA